MFSDKIVFQEMCTLRISPTPRSFKLQSLIRDLKAINQMVTESHTLWILYPMEAFAHVDVLVKNLEVVSTYHSELKWRFQWFIRTPI